MFIVHPGLASYHFKQDAFNVGSSAGISDSVSLSTALERKNSAMCVCLCVCWSAPPLLQRMPPGWQHVLQENILGLLGCRGCDRISPGPDCQEGWPLPTEDSLSPPEPQCWGCQLSLGPAEDPRGHPAHGTCPHPEGMSLQGPANSNTDSIQLLPQDS